MLIFFILFLLACIYLWAPRGTLLHEATRLPVFWLQAFFSGAPNAKPQRMVYGGHPRQYYLYCPAALSKPGADKWIIYFHGGSWRWGRPDYFLAHASWLNDLGFHVILPCYRPCPKHNYTHIAQDLSALLRNLPKQHQNWRAERTFAGGMSAGGHLAALLALDTRLAQSAELNLKPLAGFFALGAPLDLREMPPSFAIRDLAGPASGELFRKANPASYLPLKPGQKALIIHGEQDGMVPIAAASSFGQQRGASASGSLRFHRIKEGTHLGIAAWAFHNEPVRELITQWLVQQTEQR